MLPKLFVVAALIIALFTGWAAYSQRSALHLQQENQPYFWSRHGTSLSGGYRHRIWLPLPSRSDYGGFRGGGIGSGK